MEVVRFNGEYIYGGRLEGNALWIFYNECFREIQAFKVASRGDETNVMVGGKMRLCIPSVDSRFHTRTALG